MQETSQETGSGNRFLGLIFAVIALGAILYCLGETADNYRSARYDYISGSNSYSYGGYSSSNNYDYYRYKEEMETYTMIAGGGALLGLIFGIRGRRRGDGSPASMAISGSLVAAGLVLYTVTEYNLL